MAEDINLILSALENNNNESIFSLTSKEINEGKIRELSDLNLSKDNLINLLTELKDYMYIFELPEIKLGSYIRWIPLSNPSDIKLTKGAIVCDIIVSNDGSTIKCKNYKNKFLYINIDKVLLFRKLNDQEKILISVSNYLNKYSI